MWNPINSLFSQKTSRQTRKPARTTLNLESLEERAVPASHITIDASNNFVTIDASSSTTSAQASVSVTAGGTAASTTGATYTISLTLDGVTETKSVPQSYTLTTLYYLGGSGADTLLNSTGLITIADGGAGNDHLTAGTAGGVLFGNAGTDTLDEVKGGTGRLILIGGDGADTLTGGRGDNVLIGGNLGTFDRFKMATEFNTFNDKSADFATRASLLLGKASDKVPVPLTRLTSADDGSIDTLDARDTSVNGPMGKDLFWTYASDSIKDLVSGSDVLYKAGVKQ